MALQTVASTSPKVATNFAAARSETAAVASPFFARPWVTLEVAPQGICRVLSRATNHLRRMTVGLWVTCGRLEWKLKAGEAGRTRQAGGRCEVLTARFGAPVAGEAYGQLCHAFVVTPYL